MKGAMMPGRVAQVLVSRGLRERPLRILTPSCSRMHGFQLCPSCPSLPLHTIRGSSSRCSGEEKETHYGRKGVHRHGWGDTHSIRVHAHYVVQ